MRGSGISLAKKSKYGTPEKFFPIIVDNFFEKSDEIAKFGKSLPKEIDGRQSGLKSKQLYEIDGDLHNAIIKKALSCYYDLDYVNVSWQASSIRFSEIERFSENKNDIRNKGWIHQDGDGFVNDEVAGIIYLTPDIDSDSGTSLWTLKPNVEIKIDSDIYFNQNKQNWYREDGSLSNGEEYTNDYIIQREKFDEKFRFLNVFNRMIMYDSKEWHGANSYWNDDDKDSRLTLTFFIGGIESSSEYPLNRIKNNESIINDRIEKK